MLPARSTVQQDTPEVRVTEWRLAPGAATGHHTHEMDYVIVPITTGQSYFRKAGVEHDVLNETASEIVFLEIELKP